MSLSIQGRTAIVTGASSGIGRATAEALVRAGYTVFGTSRKATDTPWEPAGCSDPVKIRSMPQEGETVSLPAQTLTIPATGAASLADYGLVLELVSRPVQGRTYSVPSHSQPSLFVAGGSP